MKVTTRQLRGCAAAAAVLLLLFAQQSRTAASAATTGTATPVPGTIEAEDFDPGGEGIGYHDNTPGNAGGQYRPNEDVDIIVTSDTSGGYDVNNFETGEWLAYTVDAAATGGYDIALRAASAYSNSAFHIEVDGKNVTGSVTVPNTGGWTSYAWVKAPRVSLTAGQHQIKIVADQQYFNLNTLRFDAAPTESPYYGTPFAVPGSFEAEDFDLGGEGVAYHDDVPGNAGGLYRPNEDVDIVATSDTSGAYDVNNFETGEWLAYTIDVSASAEYDIALRAASAYSNSAFHVEIDGKNVTGSVAVPDTGGWSAYQWVGAPRVALTAGRHVLKIVSDQQYFNLNTVRVTTAPAETPYSGTPIAVPGTFEAENFDLGGEGAGYHDDVAGNAGGQYRPNEDVDIIATSDTSGGYDVNNFQTGEWLAYTVDVAKTAGYQIALRASSAMSGSAYHVEVDGKDVTGSVTVPNTGSWASYEWVSTPTVQLAAGQHRLQIVADQQYFNLNSVRVQQPAANTGPALLFKSGFEGLTVLDPLLMYGNGAWQDIAGLDTTSGFTWPPLLWGGNSRFQEIAGDNEQVTAATLPGYMYNQIQSVTGHDGNSTQALYSVIEHGVGGATQNWDSTQDDFVIFPGTSAQGDLYISYWLKYQPDLLQSMTANSWAGRVVSDWKTGTGTGGGGDYRLVLSVYGDGVNKRLYWYMQADNNANGGLSPQTFWQLTNNTVPVPVGKWFRVEMFVHRSSGADGRVWVAVDGQTLFDHAGANMGVNGLPWNRIMPFINYSSGQTLPAYQWVDDVQIWNGFPADASPH